VNSIQEETTVGDVARETPKISAGLENWQADHHTSMVEIESKINERPISILIDPGASLSYVSPSIVEKCKFSLQKFENSWLIQLSTGTKRNVMNFVENCELFMNEFKTHVKLKVLPLGSYDVLIGMDWLEKHTILLNYFERTFTCVDEKGETVMVKGIPTKVSVRKISAKYK